MGELWRIELLGRLRARRDPGGEPGVGRRVVSHFRTRKTGLLLAYLAYYHRRTHPREELIDLFWPDHDLEAGRQSLRTALSSLRQQLQAGRETESPLILADRAVVQLGSGATTDVDEFLAALQAADRVDSVVEQMRLLAQAVDQYHGELLPGYYEDWVLGERQWLAERHFRALGRLVSWLEQEGEFEQALEYAQRGVRADPLREEAHRDLIRLYAAAGHPEAALRHYQALERLLSEKLEANPDPVTTALALEIERLTVLQTSPVAPPFRRSNPSPIGAKLEQQEPVTAYRLERPRPHPDRARGHEGQRAKLIGREEELGKLKRALAAVLSGHGQIVSLIGEAGVGKSRLVAELQAGNGDTTASVRDGPASSPAPLWLEGRCQELAMTTGYSLFIDLLGDYFAWGPEEDALARGQRLVDSLRQFVARQDLSAARVEEMGPLLGHLLSLRFGTDWDERLNQAAAEPIRHQTFLAIRDFFVALAQRQPVVLICEDLHWADSLSLDLLSLLMEALPGVPLLLLCIYRPEREHRSCHLATIAGQKCPGRFAEIPLRELTPEESCHLVDSLLAVKDLPTSVREQILERTRGNPFFIEEVVRSLVDSGRLYRDGPVWRARVGLEPFGVPESVQRVIRSRIERLRPDLKLVLQQASIIGRLFRRRWLDAMTGHRPELERALWELEEQALIYQERVVPEAEYSFRHVLTQETIYGSIAGGERSRFHQQVGEAIEALHSERLDEWYEQLAYHYERSPHSAKAVEYLLKAGEKAKRTYLNAEAIDYFRRALSHGDASTGKALRQEGPVSIAARLQENMGDVLERIGRHEEARAAYYAALALVPTEARIWQSRLHRRIGDTWMPSIQYQRALDAYAAAEDVLGEQPNEPWPEWWQEWIDIQYDRISVHYRRADVPALDAVLDRLRPVVEQDSTPLQRLRLLGPLCQRNLRRDRGLVSDETLAYAREAYALKQRLLSDPGETAAGRFPLGFTLLYRGELDEAEEHLDAALVRAEQTGDVAFLTFCLTHRTVLARKRGRVDEVRQYVSRSLEAAATADRPEYVALGEANQAWVAWREGDLATARAKAQAALPVLQGGSLSFLQWAALWPLIGVALTEDQLSEASHHGQALMNSPTQPLPEVLAAAVQETIEAHDSGEPEKTRAGFLRAMDLARQMGYL